jgi:hypothetical protein
LDARIGTKWISIEVLIGALRKVSSAVLLEQSSGASRNLSNEVSIDVSIEVSNFDIA